MDSWGEWPANVALGGGIRLFKQTAGQTNIYISEQNAKFILFHGSPTAADIWIQSPVLFK